MKTIFYRLISIVLFTSCVQKQAETTGYAEYNTDTASAISDVEEHDQILADQQAQLQKQIDEQARLREQEKLAENEPVTISNFKIENCTKQGTLLSTGSVYRQEDVKYIRWTADYVDNVVKAGGKTYGTLYVKYMKKDKYSDSWEILDYQGDFTEITNSYSGYTRKYNMVDDGAETGTWSESLGSETGYDYERGKWKIELYWDKNNEGKAIYLGGDYFEIY